MRYIAIGDIHGCLHLLNSLIEKIRFDNDDVIIFLGDYIDRGYDAPGTIDRLIKFNKEHKKCVFLRGNHEAMLLGFLGINYNEAADSYLLKQNH